MKIFCDFDGTLTDIANRHYTVYKEVTEELGGQPITQKEYWELKRQKSKWPVILIKSKLSPQDEEVFLNSFISKIESPDYLARDILFTGAASTLETLSRHGDLYLVSLRRNKKNLLNQLEELNISRYFQDILIGHSENDGYDVKTLLIKKLLQEDKGVIIGDTEADIMTGKILGLVTVAVKSGIRDGSFLEELKPDYLIDNITKIGELNIII